MGAEGVKVACPVVHGEMDDDEGEQQAGSMVANARVGVEQKLCGSILMGAVLERHHQPNAFCCLRG